MSKKPSPETMPSTVLKQEHTVILRVIRVLRTLVARSGSGDGFELDSLKQCVGFFRYFADACHHAKEEDLLFPVLESRGVPKEGGPIGVMLYEHSVARKLTAQMGECIGAFEQGDAELQEAETALMTALATRKGVVIGRKELSEEIWPEGTENLDDSMTLDVVVARLRATLEMDPENKISLVTVGGFGYVLL